MKTLVLWMLLFSQPAGAQEIVLADRALKKPMTVTDTVTKAQLMGRLFPIYRDDLDALIDTMERFAHYINTPAMHEPNMQIVPIGHSKLSFTTLQSGSYNTYLVSINTLSGELGASMQVVKKGDNNKKGLRRLQSFIEYLKNNRHIIASKK